MRHVISFATQLERDLRLHAAAQRLGLPRFFQRLECGFAQTEQDGPIGPQLFRIPQSLAKNFSLGREEGDVHTLWPRPCRQRLPDLFTGEAHDGRQQSRQRIADPPQHSLGRAPAGRLWSESVEPVFQNVEVKRAQLDSTKLNGSLIDLVESKFLVPLPQIAGEIRG